jgi:hypothetical protein
LYHDDERDVAFDRNLVGQWNVVPDERFAGVKNKDAFIQIERIGETKAYSITVPGSGVDNWKPIEARLVEFSDTKILDITDAAKHDFIKVAIGEDSRLRINGFNADILRKKPDLLTHRFETLYLDFGSGIPIPVPRGFADAGITITASTDELRRFFAEHADDAEIWNEPDKPLVLKRRMEP